MQKISQAMDKFPPANVPFQTAIPGLLMILGSCNSESGPGPEMYDIKYIALGFGGEQLEAD